MRSANSEWRVANREKSRLSTRGSFSAICPFLFAIRHSLFALALAWPGLARADAIEDFYRGKTLNLMIGSGAGGGVDQVSRAVARHLGKHVPGNPTVLPRNMAGAGGLQALNFIQTVAPKDA